MNTASQAKNGFKTFIITLSVSLVVFTAIYYVVTDNTTAGIEEESLGYAIEKEENTSVFEKLVEEEPQVEPTFLAAVPSQAPAVLAGTDEGGSIGVPAENTESSESTAPVPDTGTTEMTVALIMAVGTIGAAGYMAVNNPRKRALAGFERDALKDLD